MDMMSGRKGGILKVIIIILVVLAIGVGAGLMKINSMVGEQLRITVTPEYLESNASGSEPEIFDIDVKLYTKFVCEATCKYTLTDISHNVLLDSGNFSVKGLKTEHYIRELPMDYNGYGTNLYLYRLECSSNHSTLCPAGKDVVIRKSLRVSSYMPSDEQLKALSFLDKNFPTVSENFVNASKNILIAGKILDSVNFSFDRQQYTVLEKNAASMDKDIDMVLDAWLNDDYVSAMSLVDGGDMVVKSRSLLSGSSDYIKYLYQTADNHNELLGYVSQNYHMLDIYNDILSVPADISGMDTSERASVLNFVLRSNSLISALNAETYNYGAIYADIMELGASMPKLDAMIYNRTRQGIVDNYAPLFIYSDILCHIDDDSKACHTDAGYNLTRYVYSSFKDNISDDNISEVPERFKKLCTVASDIYDEIQASERLLPESDMLPGNGSGLNGSDSNASAMNDSKAGKIETLLLEYKSLKYYESLLSNSSIPGDQNNLSSILLSNLPKDLDITQISLYESSIRNSLKNDYSIVDPDAELAKHVFNYTIMALDPDSTSISYIKSISRDCSSGSDITLPKLDVLTSKRRTIPKVEEPSIKAPKIPTTVPRCCIYDMCQPCSSHNTHNPLVLMHGHSFNQEVDAYRAIEIFDGLEYAFSGDNLYFVTGLLASGGNATQGILGRYAVPVISKPTYYLESYHDLLGLNIQESKTDNIDTYALRLKESIDHTLYLTGNDKVDIIAHSMGGLVVRRYMQIFGTEHVGTVMLVGTPSNGINDVTYGLCKLFGASAECDDMHKNSLFMSKLNDPSNQPDFSNMYLVIGRGCETEGVDGDGVVTVESAVIKNFPEDHILYIDRGDEGCSVTNVFHQDLIKAYKYPQIYEFMKSKLGES